MTCNDSIPNASTTRTSGRRILAVLGLGLGLIVTASSAACGIEGDRAMMGCPVGERCSPETPEGLRFVGAGTSDQPFSSWSPTAVGGTQTIDLQLADWSGAELPPFDAESADPRVFEVEPGAGRVTVRATGPGSALLRITDDAGALLDRTTISTADVARVDLLPLGGFLAPWTGAWAFRRGGSGEVVFALRSASGSRLIDESAQPVAGPGVEPTAWDAAHASFDVEGGELLLTIDLGAGRRQARGPLADSIDRIAYLSIDPAATDETPIVDVGGDSQLCFVALLGDRAIAGVQFEVASEGPIEVTRYGAADEPAAYLCTAVEGVAAGQATVIVRAEGEELRQAVRVEP